MDKIDCLIHDSGSKLAIKISSLIKKLMNLLKLFQVTPGNIYSFWICSEETLQITYTKYPFFGNDPKNPPPLWIIWINNMFLD